MKVLLKGTIPTVYQLTSLSKMGLPYKPNGDGSFTCQEEFNSIVDARKFLKERANYLYDGNKKEIKDNLRNDVLTYDAASIGIYKINGIDII